MGWVGTVSHVVTGQIERAPVSPSPGVNGEPPTPSFIATCQRARSGPYKEWTKYRERCTGLVPWNLPGRAVEIPVVGAALPLAGMLLGGPIGTGLGLLGGFMNGGFEQPVGIGIGGGVGAGICPPGTRCIGASAFGACLGTCVPTGTGNGTVGVIQPYPIIPGGGVPTGPVDPYTGKLVGKKRRRMNYSNQKALRRALRRATGYARQQKAIKKLAGEFAREFGPKHRAKRDVIVRPAGGSSYRVR